MLLWPSFIKEHVIITDDNLINYADWVHTYLDKLNGISAERRYFMKVINILFIFIFAIF